MTRPVVARPLHRYPVGKEAVCYGPLHPEGKRMPAECFHEDPCSINKLTQLCLECLLATHSKLPIRRCRGCMRAKRQSDFRTDAIGRSHKWCRACEDVFYGIS